MKTKMDELLSGKFEYQQPQLLFSEEKLSVTLKAGETKRGQFYVGTEENTKLTGYVTSSDRRFVAGLDTISGTTICVPYGVDGVGMNPGETVKGWVCFTTNIGEARLPFEIHTEKEEILTSRGPVNFLTEFSKMAQRDFREAYRVFTDKNFPLLFAGRGEKDQALLAGMTRQPVTYQHLEEFLIAVGEKKKVTISLGETGAERYQVTQTTKETFQIERSGWGHLRLDIETRGNFLEVLRKVVTNEDFIGSFYGVEYLIKADQLGEGSQHGEIIIRSPYQELVFTVLASRTAKVDVSVRLLEKKHALSLMQDYLSFCLGKLDERTWMASTHYILNQFREAGCDYPEYQMCEAYLAHREGHDDQAAAILEKYQNNTFTANDLEFAGVYLYLCTLTGLYRDREQALSNIQNFFRQKPDSYLLLRILLEIDPELKNSPQAALFAMEEIFEKGCKSPFLYLEACRRVLQDLSLLRRLDAFWTQVFLFAAKNDLLTQELVMRLAYLSGYEKQFSESLLKVLETGYERFPSDDTLEAVCKYIMKGDPAKPVYFPWYEKAVNRGLRLTRLYEYYVETMDTSRTRELPTPLLMYFTYNNDFLGDAKKAFLYSSVVRNKAAAPKEYESYRATMADFAVRSLAKGVMNEDYAVLYQEFLGAPRTKKDAQAIAKKMFTCRLYCDDPKIRAVVVRCHQLADEEVYPLVQGVAYPRIYTEDAVILFQDDKQRRYAATVDYSLQKLMDETAMTERVVRLGAREPGVLLHYCESTELDGDSLPFFQKMVQSEACSEEYRRSTRKKILSYYVGHVEDEDLDDYLAEIDCREYAQVDKATLLSVLIARGMFPQALSVVEEFGSEGVIDQALLKLTSRMLTRTEMAEDRELLALASAVYRRGIYDEVILQYLMLWRFGPVDELFSIWNSAVGFEMDTYDFSEKILGILMLTSDYRKDGEKILADYIKNSGKEKVIGAYLTQVAYGIFVKEFSMSPLVKECLRQAYLRGWPGDKVCHLALFKALSKEKKPSQETLALEKEFLKECAAEKMTFGFFQKLKPELLAPYQLDDKTCVEYHADPEAKVTLYYTLDTGLGMDTKWKSEPLANVYEGIFTRTFTLFYGETLHYYFQEECSGRMKKSAERTLTPGSTEGMLMSKYRLLNQALMARHLDKEEEVVRELKQYLRQEQYVKEMFVLR